MVGEQRESALWYSAVIPTEHHVQTRVKKNLTPYPGKADEFTVWFYCINSNTKHVEVSNWEQNLKLEKVYMRDSL